MSSNGNPVHWDISIFQFSDMKAVCEIQGPLTSGLGTKKRWPEGFRAQSVKTVEVH